MVSTTVVPESTLVSMMPAQHGDVCTEAALEHMYAV